jgi:hypothetical protein
MKRLNEIVGDSKNTLDAIKKAGQDVRKYDNKNVKVQKPPRARFKMWVAFKDGNKRIFHSLDGKASTTINGATVWDEYGGLMKLMRKVQEWHDNIKTCIIYVTLDPKANTSKKTYKPEQMAFKQTGIYTRYNPTVWFKNYTNEKGTHTIIDFEKFDKNYFDVEKFDKHSIV